jgi:hypothetical protein
MPKNGGNTDGAVILIIEDVSGLLPLSMSGLSSVTGGRICILTARIMMA